MSLNLHRERLAAIKNGIWRVQQKMDEDKEWMRWLTQKKIRVAVNGYGVIGKRVAAAVVLQEDMSLIGVSDVTDWRAHMVTRNGFSLFGATAEHAAGMRTAVLDVTGTLDELLGSGSTPR